MVFIRRRAKRSLDKWSLLYQAMEQLDIKKLPRLPCRLTRDHAMVDIGKCVNKCTNHCPAFLNFEYIIHHCETEDCSDVEPCEKCLDNIEKNKVLFKVLKIVANTEIEKPRKINRQMKYYKKHSGRGIDDESDD